MSDKIDRQAAGPGVLDLPKLEYPAVTSNVDAARLFVRHLLEAAAHMVENREWRPADLIEVLRFAEEGGAAPNDVLDGRDFRRRLDEAVLRAKRYGENFSVMVAHVASEENSDLVYEAVLDGLVERLRRTDQIFLFRGRFGILLPYTAADDLPTMTERISALVKAVLGEEVDLTIEHVAFPEQVGTADEMARWVEERID